MAEAPEQPAPTGQPIATPAPAAPRQGHGLPGTPEEREQMATASPPDPPAPPPTEPRRRS